jgi:hypothetical protein
MASRHRIATVRCTAPSRSVGILWAMSAGSPSESSTRLVAPGGDAVATMPASSISVSSDGSVVVIAVEQCLDGSTGEALIDAATTAVATGPARLDIDLQALESFTGDGARALVTCGALAAQLPAGLHYRTNRGPGREALLAAYRDVEADDIAD